MTPTTAQLLNSDVHRFIDAAILATPEASVNTSFRNGSVSTLVGFVEHVRTASSRYDGLADATDADIQAFITTLVRLAAQDSDTNPVDAALTCLPFSATDKASAEIDRRSLISGYYFDLVRVAKDIWNARLQPAAA